MCSPPLLRPLTGMFRRISWSRLIPRRRRTRSVNQDGIATVLQQDPLPQLEETDGIPMAPPTGEDVGFEEEQAEADDILMTPPPIEEGVAVEEEQVGGGDLPDSGSPGTGLILGEDTSIVPGPPMEAEATTVVLQASGTGEPDTIPFENISPNLSGATGLLDHTQISNLPVEDPLTGPGPSVEDHFPLNMVQVSGTGEPENPHSESISPEATSATSTTGIIDYVQVLNTYIKDESPWKLVSSTGPSHQPVHTISLVVRGVEHGRASASTKSHAKKVLAYVYLREGGHVQRNAEMDEAALGAGVAWVGAEPPGGRRDDKRPSQRPQYVLILHSHVEELVWESVSSTGPAHKPVHTMRLMARGVELGRASAGSKALAKQLIAYSYLRDKGYVEKNGEMEALIVQES
ncbi:hypothetical protein DFP72DRAFT_898790 [Ephemerocybe angulata]|uniref:DRBM domain-containing protein n=1 Tax=Ephemerocybe angulata TaxID=980116 RepID=A0A8H6HZU4_9AGAR|nr:hypothetical protein DFP72DRAFT_898790 [Tulosesus angulatus]